MESEEHNQSSDIELVIATLVGNLDAFGELVRRFRPAVRAVVIGIVKSQESVDDITQDTFLLAFKEFDRQFDTGNGHGSQCALLPSASRRLKWPPALSMMAAVG